MVVQPLQGMFVCLRFHINFILFNTSYGCMTIIIIVPYRSLIIIILLCIWTIMLLTILLLLLDTSYCYKLSTAKLILVIIFYTATVFFSMLVIDTFENPLLCGVCFFHTTYTTTAAKTTKTRTNADAPAITATPGPCCPPNAK